MDEFTDFMKEEMRELAEKEAVLADFDNNEDVRLAMRMRDLLEENSTLLSKLKVSQSEINRLKSSKKTPQTYLHEVKALESQTSYLERELDVLKENNHTLEQTLQLKEIALNNMESKLSNQSEFPEEEVIRLKNALKQKESELKMQIKENNTLKRIQDRKDKTILELNAALESEDGPRSVKHFENEKRVLTAEIDRLKTALKQIRSTQNHALHREGLLQSKMDALGLAINDIKGCRDIQTVFKSIKKTANVSEIDVEFPGPKLPLPVFDLLVCELEKQKSLNKEREDEIMMGLETIERLEKSVDVLEAKIRTDKRTTKLKINKQTNTIQKLEQEIENRDTLYKNNENVLKSEIFHLREQIGKLQQRLR
ncbi:hypothetical protein PCE1_003197 [Barthelona sp. PCE]